MVRRSPNATNMWPKHRCPIGIATSNNRLIFQHGESEGPLRATEIFHREWRLMRYVDLRGAQWSSALSVLKLLSYPRRRAWI